ncbi:MAG: cobalamin biosynthesis protein [Methanomassiliicoccaceae archaeon]|nr:cobalamin biosynthesis protein [Methanomassiliicoccaceae archaeon]
MRINIIGFSSKGCALAKKLSEGLREHECSYFGKTAGDRHGAAQVTSADEWVADSFKECGAIIFVGAVGIAVRYIAPYVKDKTRDPAVIVIDELGMNIIPILSGHIGGANRLSEVMAERIGGNAIITTATDLNDVFSVDMFAVDNDLHIGDMGIAREVSARLLDGRRVYVGSDVKMDDGLPNGLTYAYHGDIGIHITPFNVPGPFERTLTLTPRQMFIGIGCRKGIEMRTIEERVLNDLNNNKISIHSLKAGGSIDLKRDEKGLIEFFRKYKVPVTFLTSAELNSVKGEFTDSEYVREVTGVGNVCERAALALSNGGELIIKKTSGEGVSVAVASKAPVIRFGVK